PEMLYMRALGEPPSAHLPYAFFMGCYLGFDGGGTKTECVALDESGALIGAGHAGPSNPLRIGFELALDALLAASGEAVKMLHGDRSAVRAACAGLAGSSQPAVAKEMRERLAQAFPKAHIRVCTDLGIALEAAGEGPVVVLIAGTGSAVIGRNRQGQVARAGGYGPQIGDEGSAYDVGRRAVAAALRARDAVGPATTLTDKILPALACPSWEELAARIAEKPDAVFPQLVPLVVESAGAGDAVASALLIQAANDLASLAVSLIRCLDLLGDHFLLAKWGGVFGRSPLLDRRLEERVSAAASGAQFRDLPMSPAQAAAGLARKMLLRASAT
ncbi:MAG: N-acetylglucosamine kinase, partial [Pseudomonadota bacterium]